MSRGLFSVVDEIYGFSAERKVFLHCANSANLNKYGRLISKLRRELGEMATENDWAKFLSPLRNLQITLLKMPLPYSFLKTKIDINGFRKKAASFKSVYPDFYEISNEVIDLAELLLMQEFSPLLDLFFEIYLVSNDKNNIAMVVDDLELVQEIQRYLIEIKKIKNVTVITSEMLHNPDCYEKIYAFGPPSWLKKYVFTSPRSPELHLVTFDWQKNIPTKMSVFDDENLNIKVFDFKNGKFEPYIFDKTENVIDVDVLEELNIDVVANRMFGSIKDYSASEVVDARFFYLGDDWGVFLEETPTSKEYVIDFEDFSNSGDEDNKGLVFHLDVMNVEPGMHLLLRKSGGGDYVEEVANELLGSECNELLQLQKKWKNLLFEIVKREGDPIKTALRLIELGSNKANEGNLRNWMSEKKIKPHDRNDFDAIMKIVGLEQDKDIYWEAAGKIFISHIKAGFEIRKMLFNVVFESDLNMLRKSATVDYSLKEANGVVITAFLVRSKSTKTVKVPQNKTAHPFRTGGKDVETYTTNV